MSYKHLSACLFACLFYKVLQRRVCDSLRRDSGLGLLKTVVVVKILETLGNGLNSFHIVSWMWVFGGQGQSAMVWT